VYRPIPKPDELSERFWQLVQERRLAIQRCSECRRYHHPPVRICPDCLSTALEFDEVSGRGTVTAFTITTEARHPAFTAAQPYTVAVIRLDEQEDLLLLSNLPGIAAGDLETDLPVEVTFEEIAPGWLIPQFALRENGRG
jgi:uncharacterized OB-fold protein